MLDASFGDVVSRAARELGVDPKEVRTAVLEFLNQASLFLIRNGTLHLTGLGRLRLYVKKKRRPVFLGGTKKKRIVRHGQVVVSFTKATKLKKLARMHLEEIMTIEKGTTTSPHREVSMVQTLHDTKENGRNKDR